MAEYLQHLRLRAWPFTIVPRPEHSTYLAGRPELKEDIGRLLKTLSRRDVSSIHLMWSWLGAGKTHSLYFLANEAQRICTDSPVTLSSIYTEFPKGARGFIDLYRAFFQSFDIEVLVDSFEEIATSEGGDGFHKDLLLREPDLAATLRVLTMGKPAERLLATRWLRADPLTAAELRMAGISQKIQTSERATRVLALLLNMVNRAEQLRGKQGRRTIWLLDEFQRLARAGTQVTSDVNAGLHALFNACPVGLTQIICFSGPPDAKKLPSWLSPELRDRIGATKVLILPPLQPSAALLFVRDVLGHFRSDEPVPSPFFPFTESACVRIIENLAKRAELRPRLIMHCFNAVLDAADVDLERGAMTSISPEFADAALRDYVLASEDEED